ncbi:MAG: hypothetical protein NVS4B7_08930 [Ktedonobacteraceae bacterium]
MENMSTTFPTPYPDLNSVLRDFVDSVYAVLSNNFVGAYLQGSFAVGDFDLHSDVDFIMVIEEELSDEEVQSLQAVHARIYCLDIPWAQHLEGSYFPRAVLRDSTHTGEQLWYLDHGNRSLLQSNHDNTVLVRWVVRKHGIILSGPSPALLVDPIPVKILREKIIATIYGWGQEILNNPEHFNNRFYQGFIVLNYCRMLHDLHRGFLGSKLAGAEWAKVNLDPSWKGLIDRAWNGRDDAAVSSRQRADPQDFKATLQFIHYCRNKAHT